MSADAFPHGGSAVLPLRGRRDGPGGHAAAIGVIVALAIWAPPVLAASSLPVRIEGTVRTEDGDPLARVSVRAYMDARPIAASVADDSGRYVLSFEADDADHSIVVFWIPGRSDYVPEIAIVAESQRDRAIGLWNACIPRIGLVRQATVDPVLRSWAGHRREVAKTGCGAGRGP